MKKYKINGMGVVMEIEDEMNNEPVAWMSEFGQFIGKVQDEICHIPLYAQPVKELTDRIADLEKQLDTRTRELIGASFYEHDYKTMMANNKPVAWMMKSNDPDYVSDYIMFKTPERKDKISHQAIPLYTHPVKEHDIGISHAIGFDDGFKAGMQRAVEMNVVKDLSDEEVWETWQEAKHTALNTRGSNFVEVIFARAILKKASEK